MKGLIEIKFDGACHNKKGENSIMGIGVAVFFDGEYVEEESIAVRIVAQYVRGTSNVAEWEGCVEAWKHAVNLQERYPDNEIKVFGDSQLISNQFNGYFSINEPAFHSYRRMALEYSNKIKQPDNRVTWIRREYNKEADKLSKIALKEGHVVRGEMSN